MENHSLALIKIKFFLLCLATINIWAQDKPKIPEIDRIRLAEVFRLGESLGPQVWKDWNKAPFAVILVTPETEFLIRHPQPSQDFTAIGYDSLLKSDVYFRKRQFPPNLLATFPAVNGLSTVVVGQAENTSKKTSTPWVITVLHEHFHQLQDMQPNIYQDLNALNLSHGDTTGMWMLNFPFPYDSPAVKPHFVLLTNLLSEALQTKNKTEFTAKVSAYLKAREELQKLISPDDYRYLSLQLWKEGIARYTEGRIAKLAAATYKPTKEFRALKDFTSFENAAKQITEATLKELTAYKLEKEKRELFYSFGASEGLLLDRLNPGWQNRYFADKFYLEKYFADLK
jgi:hypothetical protein